MMIFLRNYFIIFILTVGGMSMGYGQNVLFRKDSPQYQALQQCLGVGWNHWNTRNLLAQVRLPEGLSISLILKDERTGDYLRRALMTRTEEPQVTVMEHSYDGSFSEMEVVWRNIRLHVLTGTDKEDLVMLVTPSGNTNAKIIIRPEIIWGKGGLLTRVIDNFETTLPKSEIAAFFPDNRIDIFMDGDAVSDNFENFDSNVYVATANLPITVSTGKKRTIEEIKHIIGRNKQHLADTKEKYGEYKDVYDAIQTALAWNTIYDSHHNRIITPVSRIWNDQRGGYILFCWDNYFVANMFALDNKNLAYANIIETTRIVDKIGFVPNNNGANDISRDRSQPPVGSLVVKMIYDKYQDKWFLEEVYERLLIWNRWWMKNRDWDGYLCWGSTPYEGWNRSVYNANGKICAMWESGLDNSPMYDDVPFIEERNMLALADVGLMSLYIADCKALAEIAEILGRSQEKEELLLRAQKYTVTLQSLWNEEKGIYLNKHLDSGKFSERLSPTNFYPMLAGVPSESQVRRMMDEHLLNPSEFWGEYVIPSISRDDSGYKDMHYWRGRIWGPMNYLVYLGMRNYALLPERRALIDKSKKLFLKEWKAKRHIYENYNADLGVGDDDLRSDNFYHWGALLGFIGMIEDQGIGFNSSCNSTKQR